MHAVRHGQLLVLDEVWCVQPIDQLVYEHLVGQLDFGATNAVRRRRALLVLEEAVLVALAGALLFLEDRLEFDVLLAPLCLLVILARVDVALGTTALTNHAALDAL